MVIDDVECSIGMLLYLAPIIIESLLLYFGICDQNIYDKVMQNSILFVDIQYFNSFQ